MVESKCIFCAIIKEEVPANFVYKDNNIVVFYDVNPKAKTHLLIAPREHVKSFLDIRDSHLPLLTNLIKVVQRLVKDKKLEGGYRVLINGGSHQIVGHLHLHLLSDQAVID